MCNLGYNGFHIESYGPYSKKSSPSQQCKQTKKSFFFVFFELLVVIIWRIISKQDVSNNKFNMLVSRIRKTVVRRQDNKSFNISTHHFFKKTVFFVPNNTAYFLQKLRPIEKMKKEFQNHY